MADEALLAYYRTIEDFFVRLRGTPFLVSPKDYSLMRRWWEEGVPLAAVLAGVGEVFERRRERDGDPVSSLSYCRHAVARHAKRLAAAAAGAAEPAGAPDVPAALEECTVAVRAAEQSWGHSPNVAEVLADLARALDSLPRQAPPAALEETLARLERTALEAILAALPGGLRDDLAGAVEGELEGLEMAPEVRARTVQVATLRRLREQLGLPRLQLATGTE
jgi:hypothetical protein